MQSEATLSRILDNGLELTPFLGEVLRVTAYDGRGVLELHVDLP